MAAFRKVTIADVPNNALVAFRRASALRDASMTDVINWCLQIVAEPGPLSALYWVENHGKDNERVTKIELTPIPPGDPNTLTINLLEKAAQALSLATQRYRCDEAGVLARAAWLAVYFDRRDGRLAYGRYYRGRSVKAAALRFIT